MNPANEEAVQRLLTDSRKCFTCPVLHSRMRKIHCIERQGRPPKLSSGGRVRVMLYNEPEDHFCRSGKCEKGTKIAAQWGIK